MAVTKKSKSNSARRSTTKKKSVSKWSPRGWSWRKMALFVIPVAVVGTFVIIKSFAATNSNCVKGYCYYPIDPKVAYWINGIRSNPAYYKQGYTGSPFLPLNPCASNYARYWSARMDAENRLHHSSDEQNWGAAMGACLPGWHRLAENIGYVDGCATADISNCSWKLVDGPGGFLYSTNGGNCSDPIRIPWKHFENIVCAPWAFQGVGSFSDKNTGRLWVTVEFAY